MNRKKSYYIKIVFHKEILIKVDNGKLIKQNEFEEENRR